MNALELFLVVLLLGTVLAIVMSVWKKLRSKHESFVVQDSIPVFREVIKEDPHFLFCGGLTLKYYPPKSKVVDRDGTCFADALFLSLCVIIFSFSDFLDKHFRQKEESAFLPCRSCGGDLNVSDFIKELENLQWDPLRHFSYLCHRCSRGGVQAVGNALTVERLVAGIDSKKER